MTITTHTCKTVHTCTSTAVSFCFALPNKLSHMRARPLIPAPALSKTTAAAPVAATVAVDAAAAAAAERNRGEKPGLHRSGSYTHALLPAAAPSAAAASRLSSTEQRPACTLAHRLSSSASCASPSAPTTGAPAYTGGGGIAGVAEDEAAADTVDGPAEARRVARWGDIPAEAPSQPGQKPQRSHTRPAAAEVTHLTHPAGSTP